MPQCNSRLIYRESYITLSHMLGPQPSYRMAEIQEDCLRLANVETGEKETPLGEKETPLGEKATKLAKKRILLAKKNLFVGRRRLRASSLREPWLLRRLRRRPTPLAQSRLERAIDLTLPAADASAPAARAGLALPLDQHVARWSHLSMRPLGLSIRLLFIERERKRVSTCFCSDCMLNGFSAVPNASSARPAPTFTVSFKVSCAFWRPSISCSSLSLATVSRSSACFVSACALSSSSRNVFMSSRAFSMVSYQTLRVRVMIQLSPKT